jgi:arabinan endo-1,5-alpha-L-arabinosidase
VRKILGFLVCALLAGALTAPAEASTRERSSPPRDPNPVSASFADTFADPAVIRGRDGWWYAYATTDPLRSGENRRHLVPTARSRDLRSWSYVGDAFTEATLPAWADRERDAALWAPDVRYVDGQYRMYYVVTQTTVTDEPNDNAIGMATAPTPAGPWTDSGAPVVGPRRGSGAPGDFLWTFDPALVRDTDGTQHLFYGSYYGGIEVVPLSRDGRRVTGPPVRVAIDNKFEGAYVVRRHGWWYLFASTANCCAGPVTGYSVQVGRSRRLTGPYRDREGVRLDVSRAGGTPVLTPNGDRWVGTGHNAVVTDQRGRDWIVFHAIDRFHPYLDGTDGINRRPMLIDRLDWIRGWPRARRVPPAPERGRLDRARSDEFNGSALKPGWTAVRTPAVAVSGGALRWPTEAGDLVGAANDASVLLREPPHGDWTAITKLHIDLGTDDVRNFQQAGLVAYVNDDEFLRLGHVAIWNTRQTEFGKEASYAGRLVYGGTIIGPPAPTTWLRLTATTDRRSGEQRVRASTSRDGHTWVHGGVWTLPAGSHVRVGLVSHGGAGATADFDWFRIYH